LDNAAYGARVPASFSIPVDKQKVLENGTVHPKDSALIVDKITWNKGTKELNDYYLSHLIFMDILANFNWDRPLYFSITSGPEAYFGLEEYFQLDGMAYRLVPIKSRAGNVGRINTTTLPDKLLNEFNNHARVDLVNNPERKQKPVYPYLWGGINDKRVYHPEETTRMFGQIKSLYLRTAAQLADEGNIEKAELLHDKLMEIFNPDIIPYASTGGGNVLPLYAIMQSDALLRLGTPTATEKGLKIIGRMLDELKETFNWFEKCDQRTLGIQSENIDMCIDVLTRIDRQLSEEQSLAFQEKFQQLKITKTVTVLANQTGAEIDYYFRKGTEAQREMFDKLAQLGRFGELARIMNDEILENNIVRLLENKIDMISAVDPQSGKMLRDYFLSEEGE
jgi:hypothetical protein